jgi:release factor glutamine methyltransferase
MAHRTIETCIVEAAGLLKKAGIDLPRSEARLLLAHVLGIDTGRLIVDPGRAVPEAEEFMALVRERGRRIPMAQILGRREFWGLDFRVTRDTLDPRPESEILVETALATLRGGTADAPTILDLGTGTGCLLLSVLSELPAARGVGVDISCAALSVAKANAEGLGLGRRARFLAADWGAGLDASFDLILSNPPYVRRHEIDRLQPEVSLFEPRHALDGGADGLDCYRRLGPVLTAFLAPHGAALLEIGAGQARDVVNILCAAGLRHAETAKDLAGHERCLVFRHALSSC